ncbi:unnamed protein product [Parajaminaea phylloscopi]
MSQPYHSFPASSLSSAFGSTLEAPYVTPTGLSYIQPSALPHPSGAPPPPPRSRKRKRQSVQIPDFLVSEIAAVREAVEQLYARADCSDVPRSTVSKLLGLNAQALRGDNSWNHFARHKKEVEDEGALGPDCVSRNANWVREQAQEWSAWKRSRTIAEQRLDIQAMKKDLATRRLQAIVDNKPDWLSTWREKIRQMRSVVNQNHQLHNISSLVFMFHQGPATPALIASAEMLPRLAQVLGSSARADTFIADMQASVRFAARREDALNSEDPQQLSVVQKRSRVTEELRKFVLGALPDGQGSALQALTRRGKEGSTLPWQQLFKALRELAGVRIVGWPASVYPQVLNRFNKGKWACSPEDVASDHAAGIVRPSLWAATPLYDVLRALQMQQLRIVPCSDSRPP